MKKYIFLLVLTNALCAEKRAIDAHHLSFLGHYYALEDNPHKAVACYEKAVACNQTSPYPYGGFIRLLATSNQVQHVSGLAARLEPFFTNDFETQLIIARIHEGAGKYELAEKKYLELQHVHKKNPELTYMTAQALSKKNPRKALDVIDEYTNNTPTTPKHCLFYFLKAQLYLTLNNPQQAYAQIKKSIDLCPSFDQGWLLMGMIHEQAGRISQAIDGYKTYLSLVGSNSEVEQQIARLHIQKKTNKTVPAHIDSPITAALSWYGQQIYDKALHAIDLCLTDHPEYRDAQLLKVQILMAMGRVNETLKTVAQYIAAAPDDQTWYAVIYTLYAAGLNSHIVIPFLRTYAQHFYAVLYLAQITAEAGLYTDTCAYHYTAQHMARTPELKSKILYNLGRLAYLNEDFKTMHTVLEQGARIYPFPPLLNLLAYYYATKGGNIIKGQQLIEQALKKDPYNPHFLDTQALIWLTNHSYEKALILLQTLIAQHPQDYYICIHYAQVLATTGKPAYAQARKAYTCARTDLEKRDAQYLLDSLQGKK